MPLAGAAMHWCPSILCPICSLGAAAAHRLYLQGRFGCDTERCGALLLLVLINISAQSPSAPSAAPHPSLLQEAGKATGKLLPAMQNLKINKF